MATICVQTGLKLACHILESPCQYVRCHCLNFFGDVCPTRYRTRQFFLINLTTRNSQLDISSRMERHPTLQKPAWPKFSPFSATASFRRDFGHRARPIWRRLTISYEGYLKGRAYQNKPRNTDALKANITEEIQSVTTDVLARTFQNMVRWVQSCLDAYDGHFQHMLCHISYTMR